MPKFFIEHPVFACGCDPDLAQRRDRDPQPGRGVLSQHRPAAGHRLATYPGASADTTEKSVTQVIEQQLTGIDHLLYFSSSSASNGRAQITLTFETGTDPDIAQVQVQNKVSLATPRCASEVTQQGVVARPTPAS